MNLLEAINSLLGPKEIQERFKRLNPERLNDIQTEC